MPICRKRLPSQGTGRVKIDLDLLYMFGVRRFGHLWDLGAVILATGFLPAHSQGLCRAARNGSVSWHWALGQWGLMVPNRLLVGGTLTVSKIFFHVLTIHSFLVICTSCPPFPIPFPGRCLSLIQHCLCCPKLHAVYFPSVLPPPLLHPVTLLLLDAHSPHSTIFGLFLCSANAP